MEMLGDPTHSREAKGMVAAEHHGKRPTGVHVRDGLTDLIERLFDVAGNGKHVARSHMEIDSRKSTPSSKLYDPYSAEILRMP